MTVDINKTSLQIKIDAETSLSLVSEHTFRDSWQTLKLSHTGVKLRSYSGETVPVVGTTGVTVKYRIPVASLPLLVVKKEGPSQLN